MIGVMIREQSVGRDGRPTYIHRLIDAREVFWCGSDGAGGSQLLLRSGQIYYAKEPAEEVKERIAKALQRRAEYDKNLWRKDE